MRYNLSFISHSTLFHLDSILFVDKNALTGTIPIELGQLTALEELSLSKCLSGLLFRRKDCFNFLIMHACVVRFGFDFVCRE